MEENDLSYINEYFVEAREQVKEILGLDLEFDELWELRKDVEFTYGLYVEDTKIFIKNGKDDKYSIRPGLEAAIIFMNRNYGTQIEDLYVDSGRLNFDRTELEIKFGYDYYPHYFKRVQEEMHFP